MTPFHNPWSFLLRFDTGDIGCLEESGRCACGRNGGLILLAIAGRKVNITLTCNGRPVTLFELDNALSILQEVDMYKLVQMDATTYELHLVSRRSDKTELSAQASDLLHQIYGPGS